MRAADGAITAFDVPGSSWTFPSSINDKGMIAGRYLDDTSAPTWHGFARFPDGTVEIVDVPGSVLTEASSINDKGMITGLWEDSQYVIHGFVFGRAR